MLFYQDAGPSPTPKTMPWSPVLLYEGERRPGRAVRVASLGAHEPLEASAGAGGRPGPAPVCHRGRLACLGWASQHTRRH